MALEDPTDTGDLVINEFWRENNLARQRAVSTIDLEPEKAVRAIQLSQASGVDPNAIIPDIESFERDQKMRMASDLIAGNPRLQAYVNSDPLAGQISNDDYGQLDTVSQSMAKLGQKGVMASTVEAFKAGFDYEGMQSEYDKLFNYVDSDVWRSFVQSGGLGGAAVTFMAALRGFRGAMFAAGTLGAEAFAPIVGANEAEKNRMRRDFIQGIEANTAGANLFRAPVAPAVKAAINEAAAMSKAAAPFIAEGKVPPTGIHPAIDQLKAEQAKVDVDNLGEALKESVKSATRDRNPDMFASFIRQHTDGEFSISAEAVQKLYGDTKIPSPDDGLLGWVPNLMGQLEIAVATGGDIKVPLADFLAKADPAIFQEIKDFIRVRDEGVTIEEGKRLKEVEAARKEIEAYHGSPHEFDAFDMGKIGEGEGAQSYGHGLYFAENQKVAQEYQRTVPAAKQRQLAALEKQLETLPEGNHRDYVRQQIDELESQTNGNMYKVRIKADPERMIDWDKPLKEQPEEVVKALANAVNKAEPGATGKDWYEFIKTSDTPAGDWIDMVGAKGHGVIWDSAEAFSQAAKAEGVQGIRYFDQQSRLDAYSAEWKDAATGEWKSQKFDTELAAKEFLEENRGWDMSSPNIANYARIVERSDRTRNLVIFDDALVEIIERNGIAIAAKQIRDSAGLTPIDQVVKPEAPKAAEGKPGEQLEMTDVTRLEDREAFAKAQAIGMTKDQYARYQKLIEKRTAEDLEKLTKRAAAEAKAKLSAAYKEAANELRPEVAREVNARPHIALDNYLREGTVEGHRGDPGRIATEFLTEEQRTALGNKFYSKDGTHPDDLATLFGFDSGQAAIEALIKLVDDRRQSGLNADNYRRRLIDTELERRLDERFAADRASILEEATDMVLSETQIEMLHEETLALATKAGAEFSITKEQLKAAIDEKFNETLLRNAKSDRFLADAARAGREAEMALLKADPAEAFRQKQKQYIALTLAKEAKALEKTAGQLDRLAKRYAKADMPNVDRGAVNFIQQLLSQAGYSLKVSPDDIARNIEFGDYPQLIEYVTDKQAMGWEPVVSDQLTAFGAKKLEAMTVQDFVEFNNAIKSLNHIGRAERKIEIAGEKQDFADFKAEVKTNLETLKVRPEASQGRWLYKIDSMLTKMEEMIKDLDVRKELGPLFNAIMVPMELSKAKSFDLLQELSNHFKQVKGDFGAEWRRTLKDTIPQDFLINPYSMTPFDMTRDNLIQIMLNWGNRSNIEKLTLGYASVQLGRRATKTEALALELQIKDLIDRHATAKDWAFVQEMWKPFKGWQAQMDTVARNTSGIAPKWIDPTPIDTPHGVVDGGYWPVKYNKLTSNITVIEDKTNVKDLFGGGYFRAATSKGYLQQRTGYIDFVDISTSIEQAAGTMQQTIHDIAFRDSLIQAGRVFYDREIRSLIRKHYGVEYEAQLVPWLKRIANRYSVEDQALNGLTDFMRRIRINLVGHALPLNLKVLLSPDIGVPNPAAWTRFEANRAENVKLAMEKSQEIRHMVYNMDRDFRENLERTVNKQGWTGVQQKAAEWGFLPAMKVSQEFRMSTFVDQYNKAKGRGMTDDQAATIADSFVRERHGAASIVDLPTLMSSSEGMKMMTLFYGYFNTMYNWQRQIPGQVRRGDYSGAMTTALGTIVVGSFFNATLFNRSKPEDSWFKVIGKAVVEQPLSTVPGLRDLSAYFLEGHAAKSPLVGFGTAFASLYNDAYNYYVKKKTPEKPISHISNVVGLSTGLPLSQVGKTGQFAADVYNRKQRPKTFVEWMKGIIHGEIKPKR